MLSSALAALLLTALSRGYGFPSGNAARAVALAGRSTMHFLQSSPSRDFRPLGQALPVLSGIGRSPTSIIWTLSDVAVDLTDHGRGFGTTSGPPNSLQIRLVPSPSHFAGRSFTGGSRTALCALMNSPCPVLHRVGWANQGHSLANAQLRIENAQLHVPVE